MTKNKNNITGSGYIYIITCKINNKKYIGATRRNVTDRWQEHINSYYRGYYTLNQPNNKEGGLLFDMILFGLISFTFEILEIVSLAELFKKETEYILKYNSVDNGYNNIASESENGDADQVLILGKESRFKKGQIPHNAIPIKAINKDNIIEFNSFNEATKYILNNKDIETKDFNTNQINYRIRQATYKNKSVFNFNWTKEGFTDFQYKDTPREYNSTRFIIGERYKNSKNYEFEIIECLKDNKRKIRFVNTGYEVISDTKEISNGSIKDWEAPYVCGVGIVGKEIQKPQSHYLYNKWRDMLRRCYDKNIIKENHKYEVCKEWLRFGNYIKDIESLKNYTYIKNKKKGFRIKLKKEETIFRLQNIEITQISKIN